jgi:hypothetical protein
VSRRHRPVSDRAPDREGTRCLLSKFDYDDKDHELVGQPDPLIVGLALAD